MTDKITISAATPNATPASDIKVMNDTNRVRRFARR
jgi:hypothetical protein